MNYSHKIQKTNRHKTLRPSRGKRVTLNLVKQLLMGLIDLRRVQDSNLRSVLPLASLAMRWFQPLTQLSYKHLFYLWQHSLISSLNAYTYAGLLRFRVFPYSRRYHQ